MSTASRLVQCGRGCFIVLATLLSSVVLSGCGNFFINTSTTTKLASSVATATYETSITLAATVSPTAASVTVDIL